VKRNFLCAFTLIFWHGISAQYPGHDRPWDKLTKTVNVSFANSDVRYSNLKVPDIDVRTSWLATAWRGEKIHTQLLIWTSRNIGLVRIGCTDLVGEKRRRIVKNHIQIGFVRYVISDVYVPGCTHHRVNEYDSCLVEDPIDTVNTTGIDADQVQPVWISISIPSTATPGNYVAALSVHAEKEFLLKIHIEVLDHVIPPPEKWIFDLDLWQHPAAIARLHGVPIWSDAHFRIMRPYYEMLAKAGQKSITASIVDEPWGHQTYDDYPSLIRWIRKKDGSWQYDYSLFDKYISFAMSCGIRQRINCYSMVPWKLAFRYYDERLHCDSAIETKPGDKAYDSLWMPMLTDFAAHLKEKGWFTITSMSMDERPLEAMQEVIRLLKRSDPEWKIALAGRYHPEIEKDIWNYSVATSWKFTRKEIQRRDSLGQTSTFYTSCEERMPNCFVFSSPAEQVWLGWYAAARGFTGYLRWAYNSWVKEPMKDARFTAWPAGDTYQVYPGPRSSIRFEKLIEGIQDFEKIAILRRVFRQKSDKSGLQSLNQLIKGFQLERLAASSAETMLAGAKERLNKYR
jgi:hypothetical protein